MAKYFYNGIKGMKVNEVPEHVKPMLSMDQLKCTITRGLDNYHVKYIQTSSIMAFSYLVALPEERCSLEHQHHAKGQGGH